MAKREILIATSAAVVGMAIGLAGMYALTVRANMSAAKASVVAANQALSVGDVDSATAYAHAAVAYNPSDYLGYALLGDIFAKQGNAKGAETMFSKALEVLASKPLDDRGQADQRIIEQKRTALKP